MRVEIKANRDLSTFEKARIDCLVTSSLYMYLTGTRWAEADWNVLIWEDDDLVSGADIVVRQARVGQRPVRLGGIATKVEWRKRGFAHAALQAARKFLHDPLGVDFGLMICTEEMVPRYRKHGWKLAARSLTADQPDGRRVTIDYPVMILPVKEKDWPEGEIDLRGLPW
jgi:predicted GNAT family N-acyltransferase